MTWRTWLRKLVGLSCWETRPCGCRFDAPWCAPLRVRQCASCEREFRAWMAARPRVCRRCGVPTEYADQLCRSCDDVDISACLAAGC